MSTLQGFLGVVPVEGKSLQPDTSLVDHYNAPYEAHISQLVTLAKESTKNTTFLMVRSHPKLCVQRIHVSTAYGNKSNKTLKRLTYSNLQSVRSAAEFELSLRKEIK